MKGDHETGIYTWDHEHHCEVSSSCISRGSSQNVCEHGEAKRDNDVEETLSSPI